MDNDADTPDKTLTVSGAISGFDYGSLTLVPAETTGILAPADATLTIRDDDQASGTVALSVDVSSAAEDAGAISIEVTATLGSGARESDVAVTVTLGSGTGDAGAESGIDFESVADFSLTIAAGDTSASASFSLTPLDDRIDEPEETLRLTGASAGPAGGRAGGGGDRDHGQRRRAGAGVHGAAGEHRGGRRDGDGDGDHRDGLDVRG